MVRAKVTTEPAGGAAWQRRETGWQRGWWVGWTKLQMAGEVAGNDARERGAAVPIAHMGPAGTRACSPGLPSHHPVFPFPGSRPRWPTRDVDGDNVGLDGTGLVPLLLLHRGQGEGPGPGRLLVGGGGEAQGGVGWPHAQRGGTAALLLVGSPAWGLQGKVCVRPNPPPGTERATSGPAVPSAVPTLFLHPMLGLYRPAPPPQGMLGHEGSWHRGAPGLTISTNSRRLEGGGRGEGSGGVPGDGWLAARKVCPVTLLSYCSSYSSARETGGPCSSCQLGGRRSTEASVPGLSVRPCSARAAQDAGKGNVPVLPADPVERGQG